MIGAMRVRTVVCLVVVLWNLVVLSGCARGGGSRGSKGTTTTTAGTGGATEGAPAFGSRLGPLANRTGR